MISEIQSIDFILPELSMACFAVRSLIFPASEEQCTMCIFSVMTWNNILG